MRKKSDVHMLGLYLWILPTSGEEDSLSCETKVGVNSHFAVVTEEKSCKLLLFLNAVLFAKFVYPNTIIVFKFGGYSATGHFHFRLGIVTSFAPLLFPQRVLK